MDLKLNLIEQFHFATLANIDNQKDSKVTH